MARYPSCSTHQYKPDELLSIQQEQRYRGRLRAQNIEHPVEHQDKQNSSSEYGFEAEWFSGDPDIEERAGNVKEDSGHNTMDMSADRAPMNIQATGHDRKAPVERLCAFPPYLAVKRMLVKGSTCRAIMQLHDRGLRASTIAREIKATAFIEKYTPEEGLLDKLPLRPKAGKTSRLRDGGLRRKATAKRLDDKNLWMKTFEAMTVMTDGGRTGRMKKTETGTGLGIHRSAQEDIGARLDCQHN
ncbi:hypothetical protein HRR78_005191 [Exophiala dermatitidis]|nr:hypothetical protein HRR75_005725 [Exophiala dermatitidis]KAJ4547093.1 hypothetical protein HRR78_005191 [Exophiala dermatitidis]